MNASSPQASEIRSPIAASWVLLIGTCLLALIPLIGFLSWFIGSVTITIAIILAIVVISKGGTWDGIFILLASMIFVPVFLFFAPILSTFIAGVWLDTHSPAEDAATTIEITADSSDSETQGISELEITTQESPKEEAEEAATSEEDAAEAATAPETTPDPETAGEDPPKP